MSFSLTEAQRSRAERSTIQESVCRGMPRWRARQKALHIAEKLALIARMISERRELERIKSLCKRSLPPCQYWFIPVLSVSP